MKRFELREEKDGSEKCAEATNHSPGFCSDTGMNFAPMQGPSLAVHQFLPAIPRSYKMLSEIHIILVT